MIPAAAVADQTQDFYDQGFPTCWDKCIIPHFVFEPMFPGPHVRHRQLRGRGRLTTARVLSRSRILRLRMLCLYRAAYLCYGGWRPLILMRLFDVGSDYLQATDVYGFN